MKADNPQKIKLLLLWEILRQESDEQHPITTNALCNKLCDKGVLCDRRTLSVDIEILNTYGFEVMRTKVGKSYAYYIEDRSFSVPELKVLIDAVQAANFVTAKKSDELTKKIASLGGTHRAKILKNNIVIFNTRKHTNESVYYTVEFLEEAIQKKKKVSFRYYKLNENREKIYQRDERYVVDPVALVYSEDNYYLVTYSEKYADAVNYRIDRMETVAIEEALVCDEALVRRKQIGKYTEEVFHMFGGKPETVQLKFTNNLISVIQDKFGEDVEITRLSENELTATVDVQMSPMFKGWIQQFEEDMKIVEQ